MPILIFRHITAHAIHTFEGAKPLFYHRHISPLDIFLGDQGLEALGNLASCLFSFVVFYGLGLLDPPKSYELLLLGLLYTTWWSLAVGLIFASLSVRSHIVAHIWSPISYLYMFFSGFVFMAAWLPTSLRNVALTIDPPLICYEIVRAGMFGNKVQTYYNIPYLTYILLGLTFVGLWLVRDVREHLEFE